MKKSWETELAPGPINRSTGSREEEGAAAGMLGSVVGAVLLGTVLGADLEEGAKLVLEPSIKNWLKELEVFDLQRTSILRKYPHS